MASSPTLSSPPLRPDSLTDEDDTMAQHDTISLPMSPPLSQESHVSFAEPEFALGLTLQQQDDQHQLVHPLDQNSPTAPKKTLNWVNALPSHFDTSSSGHPRKRRRRTNREELEILEDAFTKNLLPDAATRQELGDRLGMSVRAVQIWFQNRRQTLRKKSISSGGHPPGSEDDLMSRSDDGESRHSPCRRSSGDSTMSSSPQLNPMSSGLAGHVSKRGSRSCSNLLSSSPPSQLVSQTLLRAETCSSLPTTISSLSSTLETSSLRSPTPPYPSAESKVKCPSTKGSFVVTPDVVVKTEVVDASPREILATVTESVQDIVDVKTADLHLCMLLEEAKRRSGQLATPVMGLWSETSSKPVLNASLSGTFPETTTTFPMPQRTMSTPSIRSPPSSHQLCRSNTKSARKHRSMPEPTTSSSTHACSPYSRTASLMEQVINRQQQQQQQHHYHHYRPAPSNFKQSALSAGKHSIDNVSHKALRNSPNTSSSGLSATQLARRLQHAVSTNLKRVQSESVLHERQQRGGARCGQPAMRARRLSFGKFLFDSDDTDEETFTCDKKSAATPIQRSTSQQECRPIQELTHQAQKRRAGTPVTPTSTLGRGQSVDGDETDEEDFVAQNKRAGLKRFNLVQSFVSSTTPPPHSRLQQQQQQQHPRQQDWSGAHSPRKSLKSSLSTFSLVTSSPTRQYGFELERSGSPMTNYPILEKNRTWSAEQQSTVATNGNGVSALSLAGATAETKDLNMDELECASVLAGLGWGR
ncbi:hypothetical protein EDD21DRAFT_401491 [Dissophora ornata]|nr:hypothetical protein BGZ58_005946 [Dissophora ornata]KAI8605108.1 hypothetical protein EDD21DRAFT_401491 [Dissophora ornata]